MLPVPHLFARAQGRVFRFLMSACYSKAKLAAACAGIIYFISYVPYMYVAIREEAAFDVIPAWVKTLVVSVRCGVCS